ncbi:MAG: DUF1015 domain-containing protein [Chitinophagaceae bacterium]|nr:DUF1015 domain-containing protein [Chitinophagaceae bacterium]
MVTITPFRALRPETPYAKQVASKPYDVLNSKEAKIEAQGNPNSFLHITKSEIDLPANTPPHSPLVYNKAKDNLDAFISRNILFKENKPCYYIYKLKMGTHEQTGLVCCSSIDDYENGLIKKHEHTRPEKELDRINHIKVTGAQTGNVFLTYKNVDEIDQVIENWKSERGPVYNFTADDGIQHTVWIINDEQTIARISGLFKSNVPYTYIADGHHRAASAARVKAEAGNKLPGADHFLTTLFPSGDIKIMDYNRVIKDLNGLSVDELMQKLNDNFLVEKSEEPYSPEALHYFGMYVNKSWYKVVAREGTYTTDATGILDITILQNNILHPLLAIGDQRTDKRIDFVGGMRGLTELETRVNSGEWAIAFSLYPVSIKQLLDIADSGEVMPPKSTWFEPKLRDGLLTNLIDE